MTLPRSLVRAAVLALLAATMPAAAQTVSPVPRDTAALPAAEAEVARLRADAPGSPELASALGRLADALGVELQAPDWLAPEALRKEQIAILSALPDRRAEAAARAALVDLYVRLGFGRDALAAAEALLPLARSVEGGAALFAGVAAAACTRGDFERVPMLGVEAGAIAGLHAGAFAPGDGAAALCNAERAMAILALGRELAAARTLAERGLAIAREGNDRAVLGRAALAAARAAEPAGDHEVAAAHFAVAVEASSGDALAEVLVARAGFLAGRAELAAARADAERATGLLRPDTPARLAEALTLLGEVLAADPDRAGEADPILARARAVAAEAAKGAAPGWEEALRAAYTASVARAIARSDSAAAAGLMDEIAALRTRTLALPWTADARQQVAFPWNAIALIAGGRMRDAALILSGETITGDAEFFRRHRFFVDPAREAAALELSVLLNALPGAQGQLAEIDRLNPADMRARLDEALALRRAVVADDHPAIGQTQAIRAYVLGRLGDAGGAMAAARDGLKAREDRLARGERTLAPGEGMIIPALPVVLVEAAWAAQRDMR